MFYFLPSVRSGCVSIFVSKNALVRLLLNRSTPDLNVLSSYHQFSNMPSLFKIIETSFDTALDLHEQYLISQAQSAYRSFYSTETSLIKITRDMLSVMFPVQFCLISKDLILHKTDITHMITERLVSLILVNFLRSIGPQ